MKILAKLKDDKEPREISFTGHGQTTEAGVKEVFERIHPQGEFVKLLSEEMTQQEFDQKRNEIPTGAASHASRPTDDTEIGIIR